MFALVEIAGNPTPVIASADCPIAFDCAWGSVGQVGQKAQGYAYLDNRRFSRFVQPEGPPPDLVQQVNVPALCQDFCAVHNLDVTDAALRDGPHALKVPLPAFPQGGRYSLYRASSGAIRLCRDNRPCRLNLARPAFAFGA